MPPALHSAKERGAAMLAALCFCAVFAIALAGYVAICARTLQMSNRAVVRNQGGQLAELGLETALWSLNTNDWTGWSIDGAKTATRTLTGFTYENGASGQAAMTIANYDGTTGTRTITVNGITTLPDGSTLTRRLTATARPAVLFSNAIAALSTTSSYAVRFRSGGTVDSYDSSLGTYGSQTPSASAIVAGPTVTFTNAGIYGYVATNGATPVSGASGRVYGPSSPASPKVDPTRVLTSYTQPLLSVIAPSGSGTILPSGTATIGTAGASTPSVYYGTDLVLSGSNTLTIDGPVVISLSGNLTVSNTARIIVTTNGSVSFHVAGDIALGGNGIRNDRQDPSKVAILGSDTGNDTPTISTSATFYGVIYMPYDGLTISSSLTIYGAIVAKTVYFSQSSGTPVIHYDLNLRRVTFSSIETPFVTADWRDETIAGG
jgi:hypothetical protein